MKVLKSTVGILTLIILLFSFQTNFSSCKKETIRDTIIIKDTIRTTDTLHITDSINCGCYDLKDGLVAYYNFNGGNLNDSSGKGNNILSNFNAVKTTDRFGKANNAYLFDGKSSYMQVPNSSSLNPSGAITLMSIIKLNDFYRGTCHGNQILQKGTKDQNQGVYSLRVTDISSDCYVSVDTSKETAVGFYGDYGYSSGANDTTEYVKAGGWINMVYTYDGQYSKIYINGQLKATYTGSAVFTPNASDVFIGRAESTQYPYWLNGAIDEIRIYNKALCAGAVKQLSLLTN